jgi:ATP-dependent exoDNAse (exonuclease V) beta subunit
MLKDQGQRDEFVKNLSQNFSVIASPGTGKTTAITERVVNLINCNAPIRNLIVVTYTDRAAEEIKNRVYEKVSTQKNPKINSTNFDEIFFGTIHGFCAKFLRNHHKKVNIGEDFEIIDDDQELWDRFTSHIDSVIDRIVSATLHPCLAKHFKLSEILSKAREIVLPIDYDVTLGEAPMQNVADILHYKAGIRESKIRNFQEDVEVWIRSHRACAFPEIPENCGRKFDQYFRETMREYLQWKLAVQNYLTNKIAAEYVSHKIANNCLGYNELTTLTLKILLDAEYRRKCVENYHVILDEAQDTDELQFKILINLIAPGFYEKIFEDEDYGKIEHTSFSMVGDPKQSIYPERADVKFYIYLHDRLVERKFLRQLNFDITLRCPKRVVEFVNDNFENAFLNSDIKFSPMCAGLDAERGHVDVLKGESMRMLSQVFSGKICRDLEVKKFSDICILAPRKSWLSKIAEFFKGNESMPRMQLGFSETLENVPSLLKWVAATLHFLNNICDHRELAGILREIFGINTREVIQYFNHSNSETCAAIHDKFISLKHGQKNLSLPNFIRALMDKFHLVSRIKILNILPEREVDAHYEMIMDLTYETGLGCDDLEKKLISMCKKPQISTAVDENAVQLFSFHKSKGLEWQVVILPFMHRKRKLMNFAGLDGNAVALANEKRMLFVACTRAKKRLILIDDSEYCESNERHNIISSASLINR